MKMVVLLPIKVHAFTFTKISPFLCFKSLSPLRRKAEKKLESFPLKVYPSALKPNRSAIINVSYFCTQKSGLQNFISVEGK